MQKCNSTDRQMARGPTPRLWAAADRELLWHVYQVWTGWRGQRSCLAFSALHIFCLFTIFIVCGCGGRKAPTRASQTGNRRKAHVSGPWSNDIYKLLRTIQPTVHTQIITRTNRQSMNCRPDVVHFSTYLSYMFVSLYVEVYNPKYQTFLNTSTNYLQLICE